MDEMALGSRLAQIRRRRSMTQAQLAEAAGLSVDLVCKLEAGAKDGVRLGSLHALARALNVPTSALLEAQEEPVMEASDLEVLPLRRMLVPGASPTPAGEPPALPALPVLRQRLLSMTRAYHQSRYGEVIAALPELTADLAVAVEAGDDETGRETRRLLSQALMTTASVLMQLRYEDLACEAVRQAVTSAEAADDPVLAASAVDRYRWAFIRQGRFTDAEEAAVRAAEAIEPKLSSATPTHLAVWGRLLKGASAAAARNNRPARAAELLSIARASSVRVADERLDFARYWAAFSPTSVDTMAVENAMTAGDAPHALHLARGIERDDNLPLPTWTRHLLALAEARTATRDYAGAIWAMQDIRTLTPEWLRHQKLAHHVLRDLLDATSVRRARSSGLAELAGFVGVEP
ncbi:HTH cro/C1-type domain-containing protein [Frankia sp. AiPs1]|uniref:helix-turn-helix domain-containing protein n=1 Tax=Frankia sp. AiPa1 TaxID=573492 RepID=UPI00202BA2E5|nr:helix-turn-helix transcriptional regulator [Frankia sp. AiPa1]MCL9761008.1 helix-turn-helix domain-containing protein [Frankia sp. AiPa1]